MKRVILISFVFFVVSNSYACLCEEHDSQEELIEDTEYIIHGTVIEQSIVKTYDTTYLDVSDSLVNEYTGGTGIVISPHEVLEIKILLQNVHKGNIHGDTVTIYSEVSTMACGETGFKKDSAYFIFGFKQRVYSPFDNNNSFWTSKCSGNRIFSKENEEEISQVIEHLQNK